MTETLSADQVAYLLRLMSAAWPQHTLTEDETRLWSVKLAPLDFLVAEKAVELAMLAEKWWPPLSEFMQHYRAAIRLVRMAEQEALPAAPVEPTQDSRRWIDHARAALAEIGRPGREHDHRGPKPCAVCGGIRP